MKKSTIIEIVIIIILIAILGCLLWYYFKVNNKGNTVNQEIQTKNNINTSNSSSSIDTNGSIEVSEDKILSNESYSSEKPDESVIMATDGANLTLENVEITKEGDTTNTENSEFYGLNAAILAKTNSTISIKNSNITTNASGANAVFATGENALINISNLTINTTQNSSRGLDATYGGTIIADEVSIFTKGAHCAALATDRGEGTVTVTNGNLNTEGEGSPLIYSTGNISVGDSYGTAIGSSIAVIEGKNSININNSNLVGYAYGRANGGIDTCGVMIYQSMSGDASEGTGTFNSTNSTLTISENSTAYKTAPMFFITNTKAVINLANTALNFGSGILLNATGNDGEWGNSGSNGGIVTLNADSQQLNGNILCDKISEITINLSNNSILASTINSENTAKSISISLDATSTWNVTGDSYVTKLTDSDSTLSNIKSNGYTIYYDNSSNSWLNGKTITLSDGGILKPM